METAADILARARARNLAPDTAETHRLFNEATAALIRLSVQCLVMREYEAKAASTWDIASRRTAAMWPELEDLQHVLCQTAHG